MGAEMLLAVQGAAVADDVFHQRTVVGQQLPADLFHRSPEIDVAFKDAVDVVAFVGPRPSSAISFSISLTVPPDPNGAHAQTHSCLLLAIDSA
jgi:hypothetical protein